MVTTEESQKVKKFLTLLNPRAKIVRTQHSAIDVTSLLEERQYDESEFSSMPAWAEELSKGAHSEADEYGIESFTMRVLGRPFHAERLSIAQSPDRDMAGYCNLCSSPLVPPQSLVQ